MVRIWIVTVIAAVGLFLAGCAPRDAAEEIEEAQREASEVEATLERTKLHQEALEPPKYDPQAVQSSDAPKLGSHDVQRAVAIAINDERTAGFLKYDYEVEEVRKLSRTDFRDLGYGKFYKAARVTIEFEEPIPPEKQRWSGAVCAIGGHGEDVSGIVWLVDLDHEEIDAVSPQWDYSVSCV